MAVGAAGSIGLPPDRFVEEEVAAGSAAEVPVGWDPAAVELASAMMLLASAGEIVDSESLLLLVLVGVLELEPLVLMSCMID